MKIKGLLKKELLVVGDWKTVSHVLVKAFIKEV